MTRKVTPTIVAVVTYDAEAHELYAEIFPGNEARSGDVYSGPQTDAALREWANDTLALDFGDFDDAAVVWSDRRRRDLTPAIELLDAKPAPDGEGWIYYADETGEWFRVTADDLAQLVGLLESGDPDERVWCSDTSCELYVPEITVLGLGGEDWTDAGDPEEAKWTRYGTVRVQAGDAVYDVGCVLGVPEHLRGTARAAGGDTITPYLDAWYADSSDWGSAPRSDGARGGLAAYLAGAVLAEIGAHAHRLWGEHQS